MTALNGLVNRHDCRDYTESDPQVVRECHTEFPQRVNEQCAIPGDHIIEPSFLNVNLNCAL